MIDAILRGNVYWLIDVPDTPGAHVQYNTRPAVVVQADAHNRHSSVSIVVVATSKVPKVLRPNAVLLPVGAISEGVQSVVLCNQIHTVGQEYLTQDNYIARLDDAQMQQIDRALRDSLGLI